MIRLDVYVVLNNRGIQGIFKTKELANVKAKELRDLGTEDVEIQVYGVFE